MTSKITLLDDHDHIMPDYNCFSYSKLSLLQVQGARDRSRRQVELSQCAKRLECARSKWRSQMSRSNEYANESQKIILQEVLSVFPDFDMSPILIDRLVKLCRAEYRADVVWKHGLDMVELDCQSEIDWWKRRLHEENDEKLKGINKIQEKICRAQREVEQIKLQLKIRDLRLRLQVKGDTDQRQEKEEEAKAQRSLSLESDENDCSYFAPLILNESLFADDRHEKSGEDQTGEWIEIDDDYFQASTGAGGSEWVLCS